MVRVAKGKSNRKNKKENNYQSVNSDSDNDHYADDFDPKNPFGDDEIESFHNSRDKIMLDNLNKKKSKKPFDYSSDEQEVLAFDDDYDDEEDQDEDDYEIEDEDEEEEDGDKGEEDDLVNSSWGRKKSLYYSGNKIENDEDAELEEEEANLLQNKMLKQLDTNDFGLDAFKLNKAAKVLKTSEEIEARKIATAALGENDKELENEDLDLEKIAKNLSKMSKKEKLDFLKQESPELFELVRDFKEKINELQETLLPIYSLVKNGQIAYSLASDYIINKTKLYLMYASHLSFYFALKSQRQTVENHPIVKNILQYRNLCKQLNSVDEKLEDEISFILESIKSGKQLNFKKQDTKSTALNKVKKSVKFRDLNTNLNRNKVVYDDDDLNKNKNDQEEQEEMDEEMTQNGVVNKRAINYEIEKNKGLTPKRDKMYRNPRVRNRIKSRKALIKHKSIVPKVRTQDKRYSGEATGIRTTVVRAVKIK